MEVLYLTSCPRPRPSGKILLGLAHLQVRTLVRPSENPLLTRKTAPGLVDRRVEITGPTDRKMVSRSHAVNSI
jgi:hypothetical protein